MADTVQPASNREQPAAAAAGTPAAAPAGRLDAVATSTTGAPAQAASGFLARSAKTTAVVMQPARADTPSAAGTVGGTLFALALVLGLIFALAWLARRVPGLAGMRGGNGLRVVASLALGTRERLVVVEVGQTQLLLGTGATGTRLLHTLEAPLPEAPPSQAPTFHQLLAQRFGKTPA
ncbi:flagellar biosynthetic protein FliO [Thermomonas sp.]|uniref:flagellar biosynthetic protein FliO n=1 Tax=Thermomonas sp. TaxID=1971895 RepID=UPI00391C7856